MRFPVSLPPVITVDESSRDIPQVNALTVVRRVAERSRPSVFRRGFGYGRGASKQTINRDSETRTDNEVAPDRRVMCRRIYQLKVMLDTRSGTDRRQQSRREKELIHHILIKA